MHKALAYIEAADKVANIADKTVGVLDKTSDVVSKNIDNLDKAIPVVEKGANMILNVAEKVDDKRGATTDMISLKNGILQQFTITKDGKTISVDGNDNWSYRNNQESASYDKRKGLSYGLTGLSRDGLKTIPAPIVKHDAISMEVEDTKKLAKSLFNN